METTAELNGSIPVLSPTHQLLRFAIVGVVGLVVDVVVLWGVGQAFALDLYTARVLSYLAAATTTWALNRHFTFAHADRRGALLQWLRFVGVNLGGGAVNYATYALLIAFTPLGDLPRWLGPTIAVGAGSLAGMAVNFTASRRLVFHK